MKRTFLSSLSTVRNMAKRLSGECGESSVGSLSNTVKHIKNESIRTVLGEPPKPITADRTLVQELPKPTKSSNDKKEYKVILLPNGMRALLISDVTNLITLDPEDCSLDVADEESDSMDEEMCAEDSEDMSDSEMESANGSIEVSRKVSACEEKLAAVALCVGVGSFSDPREIPGLAHFLEHMVFMGSEKFPQENDFDEFVKKHGGFDNASTDCESTTFYFECHEKRLLRTMDKFAQFFISPLMKREAMTREREAIESEFQMSVTSDYHRKAQLLATMAKPNHPATIFMWGNLKTLRDNVSDDVLYESVHKFRARHYSAHRMTLSVQARLPLDQLEDWILKCFSPVPTNYLPPDDFSEFRGPAFETDRFCKLYTVNPVKDICQMDLSWFMPSMLHQYRVKPTEYVSWFLGHEGKGSLLSFLRKKVWALEITTGTNECDFEHNSMYCLLTMSLSLTEAGLKNVPHVIEAVFGYIKMVQEKGPQEWLYKEMQSIEESSFRFTEEIAAADYVEMLCENMQRFPPEHYIDGDELFFEYDPSIIQQCLDMFTLENMNVMISTKKPLDGIEFDQVEPWFGTQYNVRDIPREWLEMWENAVPDQSFCLPEPNVFISTDFSILPVSEEARKQLIPERIQNTEQIEVYYRQDTKFLLPNTYLYIHLVSPLQQQSPYNAVMLDVFVWMLKQQLVEELYPARMAQLSYALCNNERGLSIKCSGYSQKVPVLLDSIISGICGFKEKMNPAMFAAVKEEMRKYYYNVLLRPEKFAKDVRLSLLLETHWTHFDRYSTIPEITIKELSEFIDKFLHTLFIQCLVQGNISKEDALASCQNVVKKLKCVPLPAEDMPQTRVMMLPLGEKCCRTQSINKNDTNCITTNYYQSGKATIRDVGIVEMLIMLMEEPVFNILRTQEQLGYHVFCIIRDTFGILGFSISVNSQADKFSVDHIDSRIEAFLHTFLKDLKKVKSSEFQEVLQSLIKLKQCTDLHIKEEVDRNWEEIQNQEYIFDRKKREIEYLKDLKPSDVLKWLTSHVACGNKSNFRKLSVQIVGDSKRSDSSVCLEDNLAEVDGQSNIETACISSVKRMRSPDALTVEYITSSQSQAEDYFISDINDFKKGLACYPVHKVVS